MKTLITTLALVGTLASAALATEGEYTTQPVVEGDGTVSIQPVDTGLGVKVSNGIKWERVGKF